jgi:hypothetical protein
MIHLSYKIETKLIRKIVDKLVLKQQIDKRVYNNLPPILPAGDEPAVQTTMDHFEDSGRLSMIREETTILKVLEGVKSVPQSLQKLLVVTCK